MNINHQWRRFIAVGCVHSNFACKVALDNVLAFVEEYKPETRIDLGDVHDFTAFRSGARGTKDESADIALDYEAGRDWLKRYVPTHRTLGNHDHRIYKLIGHPNAIISMAAGAVARDVQAIDDENGTLVKPYHMRKGWWEFGGYKFGHGWMYNENAIRDHAEAFGNCVIAHLHAPGMACARNDSGAVGYCVGTLADPDLLDYAGNNRSTLRWKHGLIYGEYSDIGIRINLAKQDCNHGDPEAWNDLR